MRRLKLQMQLSLDGFVAGLNSEMDWMTWNWDDSIKEYVSEITASIGHILLGRKLAEGFVAAWETAITNPDTDNNFARQMVSTPKLVFSKTHESMSGNNVELVKGNLAEEINTLKQLPDGDIIAYGGASFAAELIRNKLVDDYHLFINPTVIGKGLSIFNMLESYLQLKLIKATAFNCGIVALHYQPQL